MQSVSVRTFRPNPELLCFTTVSGPLDGMGESVPAPDASQTLRRAAAGAVPQNRDQECVAKATAWANYAMGELNRIGGQHKILKAEDLDGIHKVLALSAQHLLALRDEASRGTSQQTQMFVHETVNNLYAASSIYAQIPISQFRSKFFQVLYTRLTNLDTQKQNLTAMSGNVQRVGQVANPQSAPGPGVPMPSASAPPMAANPGGPTGMIPGTPGMQPGIMTPAMIPGTMPFQMPFSMGMMPGMMPGMMMPGMMGGMPGMMPPIPYMPGMMPSVSPTQINLPTATLGMPMTVPTVTPGMPTLEQMSSYPSNGYTTAPQAYPYYASSPYAWPNPGYVPSAAQWPVRN